MLEQGMYTERCSSTKLGYVCKDSHDNVVSLLIAAGADVDFIDMSQHVLCSSMQDIGLMQMLLRAGANVNWRDEEGNTLIHYAVSKKHHAAIKVLVDAGVDVNAKNDDGFTALQDSLIYHENKDVFNALIETGADINVNWFGEGGNTLIHYAVWKKHHTAIKVLVDAGVDINAKNDNGFTALQHSLAYHENKDVFNALIETGADVNVRDNDGHSILYNAINGFIDYYLAKHLSKNWDWDFDDEGIMFINPRQKTTVSVDMICSLIEAGAKVVDRVGNTALHLAVNYGYIELLKKQIDVEYRRTFEARFDSRYLLRQIDGENWHRYCKHKFSSRNKLLECILQQPDVDINARNSLGETPLMLAVTNKCDIHTIDILCRHQADRKATDIYGRTALDRVKIYWMYPPSFPTEGRLDEETGRITNEVTDNIVEMLMHVTLSWSEKLIILNDLLNY